MKIGKFSSVLRKLEGLFNLLTGDKFVQKNEKIESEGLFIGLCNADYTTCLAEKWYEILKNCDA